jgi:hypothetical protein
MLLLRAVPYSVLIAPFVCPQNNKFAAPKYHCVLANKLSSPHIPQKNRRNTTFYPKSALSHLLNALFCISSKKTQNPGIFCLI